MTFRWRWIALALLPLPLALIAQSIIIEPPVNPLGATPIRVVDLVGGSPVIAGLPMGAGEEARITEAGDRRVTESGDARITE